MRNIYLLPAILSASLSFPLLFSAQVHAASERYYVNFKADAITGLTREERATKRADHIAKVGAKVARNLNRINAASAVLTDSQIKALLQNSAIESIEEDPKRYLSSQTQPYGIGMVQADLVSDSFAGNRTVCITDSGFSIDHEDLSGNNVTGTNDPGTGDWFFDGDGHGTHVAGTIAALNNDVGVLGIMPNAHINLHIVKVFGDNGNWGYSSDLVAALEVCQDNGADVVNMSLGGSFSSNQERNAMQTLYDEGMLLIAAAGNSGNSAFSYPASYDSVISVAAIDSQKQKANFSQFNSQVELSGPGVGVLSTVPGQSAGVTTLNTSALGNVDALAMELSVEGSASGDLVNCGLGTSTCPTTSAGNICLIERGDISFNEKAHACEDAGGVAAIIYNNEAGTFSGTLGTADVNIPVVSISQEDGATLATLGGTAQLDIQNLDGYAFFDGTSMATPHVVGVAGLVWSQFPECTNQEIRNALTAAAEDLGTAGRDDNYGFGLVQAKSAVDLLTQSPCGTTPTNEAPVADAGDDIIAAPRTVVQLNGENSFDPDGSIVSYSWRILSGRARLINSSSATPRMRVSNRLQTITVELTVTDDQGATAIDTVDVIVQ